jgi:arginyl-tRNA synthetase
MIVDMLNLKEALAKNILVGIETAQKKGELPVIEKLPRVVIDRADNKERGDYASPVALALTKDVKKPPMDIVKVIVKHMPKKGYIGRITAAEPGFLNIRLNPGWLMARLDNVIEQDVCEGIDKGSDKSINLEFISANPTGPLTLANSRTAFSIDTLGNVLACAGYNVTREYYINDAGRQVLRLGESVLRRALEEQGEKVDFPEELYQGEYIKELAKEIAENWRENEDREFSMEDLLDEKKVRRVSDSAVEIVLAQIKETVSDVLKIKMDVLASEKSLRKSGVIEKALEVLRKGEVTYVKEGVEYFETTKFGDDQDRVLVKSDGEYAYIAPDIGYHQEKYDREFDKILTVVGADHQGHIPKLKWAMKALGNDVKQLKFIVGQWLHLKRDGKPVKISKRSGEVFGPGELIEEIGYDAARFFLVQHKLDSHMELDLDLAKERSERNPVYYVQYAYVRLQSILRQAKERGIINKIGVKFDLTDNPNLTHTLELDLMRQMYRFPEVVSDVTKQLDAHNLTYYALDLAKAVHVFYRHVHVIGAENKKLVQSRLQLVLAARTVLGKTLDLLSVSKPDVM